MKVTMISPQNKNHRIIFLFAVFFCVSVFVVSLTNAADPKESLENQLDAIKAKIKAYNQIINLKERQGATLTDQIQSLEAQANKLELEIELNKNKIDDLQESIASLSSRIAEKESLINSQKQMLSELMQMYYSDYSGGIATLVFSSNETVSYLNQESWTTQMNSKLGDLLDSVKTLRESLAGERAALEEKKKVVDELHIQLTERNDYLESAKDNKQYLLTKTQAEITKYDNLVDDLQKQREEIENEIEELEAGKVDQLSGMPSFKKGLLAYPLKKFTISQVYGKTSFAKRAYKSGKHNGIDFAAATGTPIYAAASGKVVGTGNLGKYAYGKWVAIDHGNGLVTLYGHMNSISVSKGSKVDQGSKIGTVGSTGYSTGPHVHFTVFSESSYEVVPSKTISGLMIPIGATVNPSVYLP
jgi:murein DD-endopeptidase MepM/ murein hydrolase activator NlpD